MNRWLKWRWLVGAAGALLALSATEARAQIFSDSFDGNLNNWSYKSWDRANQAEVSYGPWAIEGSRLSNCSAAGCDRGDSLARRAWTSVATNASGYTIDTDLYVIGSTYECKVIFTNAHRDEAYRVDVMNLGDKVRVTGPAPSNMRDYPVTIDGNGTGYHLKVVVSRSLVDVYFNRHGGAQQKILSLSTGIFPDGKVGVGTYGGDCDFDNFVVSGTEGVGNGTANLIPVFGYERTEACDEGPYNTWKGERLREAACDRPLFTPWNRDDQQWWNAMVEEMQRASITTIAAHNRGCYDWDPSGLHGDGDMCPRHLSKLITALRANGSSQKIAMWDDFLTVGSHYYWENNGAPFSFNPANVANWQKYIWDLRWKIWFDNVPSGDRYTYGGRPVIFMWFPDSNNPAYINYFARDAQGNMSQMIEWMRNKVRNVHGVNPFIIINYDMYMNDTTLNPANQPNADRRPDMVYAWFDGADAVNPSPIYTFNGLKAATAVPGFRDKICAREGGEGGEHVCSGPPGGSGIREIPRHHGHKLIEALEHKKNANFVLLEGWTNIIESAGFYRSLEGNDPRSCTAAGDQNTVDYPNQVLSILHRYMNPNRTQLVLEAETADHYRDDDPTNNGGSYRATNPPGSLCTLNELDVGFDGSQYYVGWVSSREFLIFRDVYLPAGTYTVTASYATPQTNARQCVQVNQGQELCSGYLSPTGGWDGTWASVQLGTITVKKGMVDFKIRFPEGWSNLNKITLTPGSATVPTIPTNVTATAISGSEIRVTWADNSSNETGFRISNGVTTVSVGANTTSYTWGGLSPGTYMCFALQAYNAAGSSAWTPWACTTTPTVPAVPTNVTVTALSSSQIRVNWADNSNNETGFQVSNGVSTVTLGANTTSYIWGGISPGTWMCFDVRSYNSAGYSAWTPWACTYSLSSLATTSTAPPKRSTARGSR